MTTNSDEKNLAVPFLLVICGYFALHVVLRVSLSGSLDYDEAEQALLSQWLLAGYTEQPPLYSWIQHFLFVLFGKTVFAVSLLKNSLLLLTYICVFFAARILLKNDRPAILATVSLLLIPQIAWESQRDMTHTTLVVFTAAATLWQTLRLLNSRTLANYCILGLLLGTGILAKANFALFLTVLLLTLSSFPEGRKILFSKKILLSLLIALLMSGAYLLWMSNNQDIVFSATHKFKRRLEYPWLKGSIDLVTTTFQFLTPLWLLCLLVFPAGFTNKIQGEGDFHRRFINRFMLFLFVVLLAVVLIGKVTYVKDRWLQPLLFVAPIFFFARLPREVITAKRFKIFLSITGTAALAIYLAFTIRVVGASYIGNFCRLNYPYNTVAAEMRRIGFDTGLIISDDRFVAGNLHLQFPTSTALIPEYRFETLVDKDRYVQAAVVWQANSSLDIPEDLSGFIDKTYGIGLSNYPIYYMTHPYHFARTETLTLAVILFPLSEAQ